MTFSGMRSLPQRDELERKSLAALKRARTTLVLEHPFFGTIALRMRMVCDETCPDLWADGRTLACNPAFAAALSEGRLVSALAHEVLHIALGHHVRRGDRDEGLWNKACDYAVNQILAEAGFSLPDGAPYRKEYAGKSADEIYAWLARLQDTESHGDDSASQNGEQSSFDAEGSGSLGGQEGQENESRDAARSLDGDDGKTGEGEKGSRVSDEAGGREKAAEHAFRGEVRDHPLIRENGGDAQRAQARQEADVSLVQAMQEAMRMGSVPAGIARLVRQRVRPVLNWRQLLARFLENCTDNDYSWTQPDKRFLHQDLYLPSRREAKIPEVVLAVDCSGSVDAPALERFCAELSGLLEDFDTKLTVLYHDMNVNKHEVFTRQDMPFAPLPVGGGGTDFRPVPSFIDELGIHPACLLWFTDMECDRFPDEPPYPVLWVKSGGSSTEPPFGEVLALPAEQF